MKLSSRSSVLLAGIASAALMGGCARNIMRESFKMNYDQFMNKGNGKAALTMADKTLILPVKNACDKSEAMPRIPVPNYKTPGGSLGGLGGGLFGGGASKYNAVVEQIISTALVTGNVTQVIEPSANNYAIGLVKPVPGGVQSAVDVFQNVNWAIDGAPGKILSTMAGPDMCILTEAKKRAATKLFTYDIIQASGRRTEVHFRISDVQTGLVKAEGTFVTNEGQPLDANYISVPEYK